MDITLRYTFTEVVRDGGEGGREWEGLRLVLNFGGGSLPKLNKCEQGGRGSRVWAFYDNVIIECPLIGFPLWNQLIQSQFTTFS